MVVESSEAVALLSIHPRFVEQIFRGIKTVEFRRTKFKKAPSSFVVYATSPVKKLVGVCSVDAIVTASPEEIWQKFGDNGGIEYAEFKTYFKKAEFAVAILIGTVRALDIPVDLSALKKGNPPQSFEYLPPVAVRALASQLSLQPV